MVKNTCKICGAELVQLLLPGSFFCPNECDKKQSKSEVIEQTEPEENWQEKLEELKEEYGSELIDEVMGCCCIKIEQLEEYMQDNYQGTFDSLEAYAYDWFDGTGELDQIPEHLRNYFDYDKWVKDLRYGGDIFTIETSQGISVFFNN